VPLPPPGEEQPKSKMGLSQKIALNSTAQAGRQIFVAAAGIISVGVATRYLPVDEYGAVLAALVLVGLFGFATDFGIAAMTVRAMARDPDNEVPISSSAFWVWVAFNVPAALAVLLVAQLAYPGADNEVTRTSVLIMMTIFPLSPFAGVAGVRAVAEQKVWLTSLTSMVARAISLAAVIAAAAFDLGAAGITAAFATGYIFEQGLVIVAMRPKIEFRVGLHRARIWSLVVAAVPLGLVMMINGLYFRLDAFLLSLLGTQKDLAVYGVAYKGFEALLVLPEFVMVTLLPVLAKLEFDHDRYRELVQKAFTAMTILVVPIFGFAVFGREAMVALAGPKFAGGGLVLSLIMCAVAFSCVQGVFGNALVTQGKQKVMLRVSLSVLAANAAINLAAIPLFGDTGAAAALLATEVLQLALTLQVYSRLAPIPHLHHVGKLFLALAALLVVVAVCLLLPNAFLSIGVGVILGSIVYIAVLRAFKVLPRYMSEPVEMMLRSVRRRRAA